MPNCDKIDAPCGKFVIGSADVFITGRGATYTFGSMASCDKDSGLQPLATGFSTVMINIGMAGRQDEKVGCSAKSVPQVSPDVFIADFKGRDPRIEKQARLVTRKTSIEIPHQDIWRSTLGPSEFIAGPISDLPDGFVVLRFPRNGKRSSHWARNDSWTRQGYDLADRSGTTVSDHAM